MGKIFNFQQRFASFFSQSAENWKKYFLSKTRRGSAHPRPLGVDCAGNEEKDETGRLSDPRSPRIELNGSEKGRSCKINPFVLFITVVSC